MGCHLKKKSNSNKYILKEKNDFYYTNLTRLSRADKNYATHESVNQLMFLSRRLVFLKKALLHFSELGHGIINSEGTLEYITMLD